MDRIPCVGRMGALAGPVGRRGVFSARGDFITLHTVLIEVGESESHELLNTSWMGPSGSGDPHGVQGTRCGGLGPAGRRGRARPGANARGAHAGGNRRRGEPKPDSPPHRRSPRNRLASLAASSASRTTRASSALVASALRTSASAWWMAACARLVSRSSARST